MVRWARWHCPPDTGFKNQTLEVWGWARYLSVSVTEAPFTSGWGRNKINLPRAGNESRTLAWKAAMLTTNLMPPPVSQSTHFLKNIFSVFLKCLSLQFCATQYPRPPLFSPSWLIQWSMGEGSYITFFHRMTSLRLTELNIFLWVWNHVSHVCPVSPVRMLRFVWSISSDLFRCDGVTSVSEPWSMMMVTPFDQRRNVKLMLIKCWITVCNDRPSFNV